ncbi:hypothetical protein Y1Q_0013914 [Alligator mississippiensis]|uniref:Uncharacterized protein n=1 Tax=Alligator mississippiensis TaxID=8496 RepID=A0A151MW07_ALLMI|nr:hypothetical protein Y1Q_0013914 [Alligator mississippiensis]
MRTSPCPGAALFFSPVCGPWLVARAGLAACSIAHCGPKACDGGDEGSDIQAMASSGPGPSGSSPQSQGGDRGSPALPGHPPAGSLEPLGAQMVPGAFPDIYDGDSRQWEAHFRGIQRAYQELGKAEDFAIRVLTEDFTLPFPFAWPPASPPDCASCSFFLRPGCPVPRFLQPLHTTAQAFVKKRQLEQLALRYAHQAGTAMETGATPTSPREPTADGRGPAQPHCSPQ